MFTILIALAVGILGGTIAGALAGRWSARRQRVTAVDDDPYLDSGLDRRITHAAREWAVQQGQPEAAPLVAAKLRMLHVLHRGRSRRRRWRWSR